MNVELAAALLGMKPTEVVSVMKGDHAHLVTTIDGQVVAIPYPAEPTIDVPTVEVIDDGGSVPAGTMVEIMAWVGGDPYRAAMAWEAEQARERPRISLLEALERYVPDLGD